MRQALWKSDTQFNYQQVYRDIPVFSNTEIVGTGNNAYLSLKEKSDNNDDITFSDILDYVLSDALKITVADGVVKLLAQSGIDKDWPFTIASNYTVSDSNKIEVSSGNAKLKNPNRYAQYHFNEASGTNVSDSSGNSRDGTLINMEDVDWQVGKLNNSIRFNEGGTNNEYCNCGNIAAFERDEEFSYEFWIKGTDSTNYQTIFSKTPYGSWQGLEVFIFGGKIQIYLLGSGEQIIVAGTANINTGSWVHGVITYNGNSDYTGITIYVNAVDVTGSGSGTLSTSIVNGNNFQISGRAGSYNILKDYMIDEFVIYDKELSLAEVQARYNSGNGTEELGYVTDNPYVYNNTGQVFSSALLSFTETATKPLGTGIKYHVSSDDGVTWKYWNGASWVVTDDSYTQANIASDINTNISTLAVSGTFRFRALLNSDGFNTPLLDNVNIQSPTSYPTDDNLYVETKDTAQIAPTDIFEWLSTIISNNMPANTDVKILFSVDGRVNWLTWSGSDWTIPSDSTLRANATSITDATNNFSSLLLGDGTLDARVFLYTSNNLVTPQVLNINVISDAGYETSGYYLSTDYFPSESYFGGLLMKDLYFDIEEPDGTNIVLEVRFTNQEIEEGYVQYDENKTNMNINGYMIQWKATFTTSGKYSAKLNELYINFDLLASILVRLSQGLWY